MNFFKYLSGLALLNLVAVGVISNIHVSSVESAPIVNQTVVTPSPKIVVRKVVTKVYKTVQGTPPVSVNTASAANPQPTAPPAAVQNKCIVTIDGAQYDVTNFRNMHSGGDIFNCGSDMSQIFWSRHNAAILAKMQQYKI